MRLASSLSIARGSVTPSEKNRAFLCLKREQICLRVFSDICLERLVSDKPSDNTPTTLQQHSYNHPTCLQQHPDMPPTCLRHCFNNARTSVAASNIAPTDGFPEKDHSDIGGICSIVPALSGSPRCRSDPSPENHRLEQCWRHV